MAAEVKGIRGYLQRLARWAKLVRVPFIKMPIYYIVVFFYQNIIRESVSLKASSIAFNLFLSMFPSLIFLFTLIPYFPIHSVENDILDYFQTLMPSNSYLTINETLKDILEHPRGGLLSFSLMIALYFASNGLFSLLETFNPTDKKNYFYRRLRAMWLTIFLGVLFLADLTILLMGEIGLKWLIHLIRGGQEATSLTIMVIQWVMMAVLIFCANILLYYVGEPNEKQKRWRYALPGAVLATLFVLITSLGYSFYVNHWGNYNKLYGSIGALIITMLWLYFNSMVLILGHEFNRSLHQTRHVMRETDSIEE